MRARRWAWVNSGLRELAALLDGSDGGAHQFGVRRERGERDAKVVTEEVQRLVVDGRGGIRLGAGTGNLPRPRRGGPRDGDLLPRARTTRAGGQAVAFT